MNPSVTLAQRALYYKDAFSKYPDSHFLTSDRWISATWFLGNNYRGSGFYGSYPPGYLTRMAALFPDAERVVHLFSGSLPPGDYLRVDLAKEAELRGKAEDLSELMGGRTADLIYADPPYSVEDAQHYGTPMVNRRKAMQGCHAVLEDSGWLVWLDQVLPMYSKAQWHLAGAVGIIRSTNHRVRMAFFFRKARPEEVTLLRERRRAG